MRIFYRRGFSKSNLVLIVAFGVKDHEMVDIDGDRLAAADLVNYLMSIDPYYQEGEHL